MSFQIRNTFLESVIENIVYTYLRKIQSLTGPNVTIFNNIHP